MASTRLERIVCALVAGTAASETEESSWQDDDAFAAFVLRRARAVEKALCDAESLSTVQQTGCEVHLAEFDPPTFSAMVNTRSNDRFEATFVYFIQSASGQIKIGKTSDIPQRIQALQATSAEQLRVVGWIHDVNARRSPLEKKLHRKFAGARVMGEWFRPVPELIEFIKAEARSGKCAT